MAADALDVVLPRVSVLTRFRAFWAEVQALRASVTSELVSPADADGAGVDSLSRTHSPAAVLDRLAAVLETQDLDLGRRLNGAALRFWREAEYAMVATADDLFVTLPWTGAAQWRGNLLETRRFGTRSAGQSFYAALDQLIERADPNERELAAVYLTALALGFRGKYVGCDDDGVIDRYKRDLHQMIFGNRVGLSDPFRKLLPECYEHTTEVGPGPKLRSPRIWWWAMAGVVAAWLIFSYVAWTFQTQPIYYKLIQLRQVTDQLEAGK